MKIGYAALTKGLADTSFRTIRLKDLDEEKFYQVVEHNINILKNIINYNIFSNIKHFRISSDIIPMGSHEKMRFNWQKKFKNELEEIGSIIDSGDIRVSMHPGQYTVINSPNKLVVDKSVEDLRYHCDFLNSLNRDYTSKIILHIGGVYGDKESGIERFINNYKELDDDIKSRLVIENDDKSYNIMDVFRIGLENNIPVVYDNLHNGINKANSLSDRDNIVLAGRTWKEIDGRQKVHYSQQALGKKIGSHSETIDLGVFKSYYDEIKDLDIDIMLEVKDKNLSAVKVNNYIFGKNIKFLEKEWEKYKYLVLEHSPRIYNEIRNLLKDKSKYPVLEFYSLIDQALTEQVEMARSLNALEHVWGYFKDISSQEERKKYERYKKLYIKESYSIKPLKKYLFELSKKYYIKYLLDSYYFHM